MKRTKRQIASTVSTCEIAFAGFVWWQVRTLFALFIAAILVAAPASAWEHWGADPGGTRFSSLAQITPANVTNLVQAWQFRTGDLDNRPPDLMKRTKFEATPLFVEDSIIFCSPFNEVIALATCRT